MSKPDLIAEAKRLAGFAPEKPESVHDVVCAGFNALYEQFDAVERELDDANLRQSQETQKRLDAEQLAHRQGETIYDMTVQIASLRHALTTVRAECDLPDYIAEFVGDALASSEGQGEAQDVRA